jgi:hypothetical protein
MLILQFYRLYTSLAAGVLIFLFVNRSIWLAAGVIVVVRAGWFFIERGFERFRVNRLFKQHIADFKQQCGPYGIRIANRAESDYHTRVSLAEVFEPNHDKLKKAVDQLEMLNTIFNAGMRPEGDEFLLHDLKLKYGRQRLEQEQPGIQAANRTNI